MSLFVDAPVVECPYCLIPVLFNAHVVQYLADISITGLKVIVFVCAVLVQEFVRHSVVLVDYLLSATNHVGTVSI